MVGKDILRFHAVIWPAMLMAAGLDVPRGVFAHGWLLVGGEKMSKSKLTGIAPTEITDVFGSDAYRFYFLSAIAFGQDGSFSWEDLSARYQAELANGFGNLASRTIAMIEKYFEGIVPPPAEYTEQDLAIQKIVADAAATADAAIEQFRIDEAIARSGRSSTRSTATSPRTSRGRSPSDEAQRGRLGTVLYTCRRGAARARRAALAGHAESTEKLWVALGAAETLGRLQDQPLREAGAWGVLRPGTSVNGLAPLFPRVEHDRVTDRRPSRLRARALGRRRARIVTLPGRLPSRSPCRSTTTTRTSRSLDGDEPLSLTEQLDRAAAVGVAGVVQAGGDIESSRWAVEAAASRPARARGRRHPPERRAGVRRGGARSTRRSR